MKKILFIILTGTIMFSGCKFINEKVLKKGSDTLEVYVYNLERQLQNADNERQASIDQIMQESQAKIDSIIAYYEGELSSSGGRRIAAATGTYYLIVGSFKTPAYAAEWSAKVSGMGYRTEIVQVGYWNLVSAGSHTNLREALQEPFSLVILQVLRLWRSPS